MAFLWAEGYVKKGRWAKCCLTAIMLKEVARGLHQFVNGHFVESNNHLQMNRQGRFTKVYTFLFSKPF